MPASDPDDICNGFCCPFGCYACLPSSLSFIAWLLSLGASYMCYFFVIRNELGEERGIGYWFLEGSVFAEVSEVDFDTFCTKWSADQQLYLFDGIWHFGRGCSLAVSFAGKLCLFASFLSFCLHYPPWAVPLIGILQILVGTFSLLLLVGLSSDLCSLDPCDQDIFADASSCPSRPPGMLTSSSSSCRLAFGAYTAIVAGILWIASGVSFLFLYRFDRFRAYYGDDYYDDHGGDNDDYKHNNNYGQEAQAVDPTNGHGQALERISVQETTHGNGQKTIVTTRTITNPDGSETITTTTEEVAAPAAVIPEVKAVPIGEKEIIYEA